MAEEQVGGECHDRDDGGHSCKQHTSRASCLVGHNRGGDLRTACRSENKASLAIKKCTLMNSGVSFKGTY